jgi:hypothetical protein
MLLSVPHPIDAEAPPQPPGTAIFTRPLRSRPYSHAAAIASRARATVGFHRIGLAQLAQRALERKNAVAKRGSEHWKRREGMRPIAGPVDEWFLEG